MVEICPKCGNFSPDKTVTDNTIACPKCGHSWEFLRLPLFIVTGASGVGKSTTVHDRGPGHCGLGVDSGLCRL